MIIKIKSLIKRIKDLKPITRKEPEQTGLAPLMSWRIRQNILPKIKALLIIAAINAKGDKP